MKSTFKIIVAVFAAVIFLSSCNKDKKIENRLTKNGGKWKITSVSYNQVDQTSSGQSIKSGTAENPGSFTFEDSGKGSFSYVIEGNTRTGEFSWSVSDEEVSLTYMNQTFNYDTFGFDQSAIAYTGYQPSKTELILEGAETTQNSSGGITQSVFTGEFELTKE